MADEPVAGTLSGLGIHSSFADRERSLIKVKEKQKNAF
jgi:hypothetical protein